MTNDNKHYRKMTETPVLNLLISLSIPTIISMLVTNIYNMVDTAFVGTIGTSANAAVGILFGFMSILQAIGFMFGQGSGSILSRKLGEKNIEQATQVASTGFFFSFGFGATASLICFIFMDPLCFWLGSTDTVLPYARTYISFLLIVAPLVTSTFTLNNILRYEGKAMLGMIGMMTGALLNILGDAIFIFVFDMGIAGAGLSTALSQAISFFILLSMFVRGKTQCKISIKRVKVRQVLSDVIFTGFPSMLRQGLSAIATVVLNMSAKPYGDAAIAGMSNASRVAFLVFSITLGIGQGFQPISAFNYGAKRFDRVKKAYMTTILVSTLIIVGLDISVALWAEDIIYFIRPDMAVVEVGARALRLQCMAQLVLPYCMTVEMLLQSTGKRLGATFLSATRNGLFLILGIIVLSKIRGIAGIQEAQPLANLVSVIPTVILDRIFWRKIQKNCSFNLEKDRV